MQKITPFLWFDNQAEEAMQFYTSLFKDTKVLSIVRCGDAGPGPKGSVLTASFQLNGQTFIAMNGGPQFPFTEAVSFSIDCADQAEIDYYWDGLSAGGVKSQCGWLKDKYGLSWQVVTALLPQYLSDKDGEKSKRVMLAMMKMSKIIIKDLEAAYKG
jgi:predicted 3-demethylubiquinone-9 3-methyltransferase (glyoxalase superfamily)